MTSIRKFAYATLWTVTALNFAAGLASAQEPAHGKFTLTHDVRWENAKIPVGDYEFSFDPGAASHMMYLTKLSGSRASFLLMVPNTEDAKPTDQSRLILETTPNSSYVSAMQLPEFGMTLNFAVPAHTEKQIAKAATSASATAR